MSDPPATPGHPQGLPATGAIGVDGSTETEGQAAGRVGELQAECERLKRELRRTKELLAAGERRRRALVDATGVVLWRSDLSGSRIDAVGWDALTKRPADPAGGGGWMDAVHPEDRRQVVRACAEARAARRLLDIEFRIATQPGTWRWVRLRGGLAAGGRGQPFEWVGLLEDIHDQRLGQAELQRVRAFLDRVLDVVPVGVFVKDVDSARYEMVNRAAANLLGLARDDLLGHTAHEVFGERDAETFKQADIQVFELGKPVVIEEQRIEPRHGGRRLWRAIKVPFPETEDGRRFVVAVTEDITERKEAEERIRSASEMLSALIDASPVAIIGLDQALKVTSWNRAAERIFGFPAAEVLGQGCDTVVPAAERIPFRAIFDGMLADKAMRGVSLKMARRDGKVLHISASGGAILDRRGNAQGFVLALEDVTERHAIEAQLRQAQKMEAIGQLTGGLAHDFNNLLAVIIGNLDLLEEHLAADRDARAILEQAVSAALRGADLTHGLLAFARRQPLRLQPIDVNALLRNTAELLRRTLGAAIEIELALAPDTGTVVSDPTQLATALTNLAVNARDAMPGGGRLLFRSRNVILDADYAATAAGVPVGSYVAIDVSDTGSGMPREVIERAFEPFFTTKEVGRGTGLGLSMVFGLVQQSGGHVRIYSEVGHGTTIRLYLPLDGRREPAQAVSPADDSATVALGAGTILAVEDDEHLRRVLVRQLSDLGYTVVEAANARAALALVETDQPIDLLLTDIVMPGGMNGWELAEEAKRRRPWLRIVFTSGFPDVAFGQHRALPEGARLLGKPYRRDELARTLREAIND